MGFLFSYLQMREGTLSISPAGNWALVVGEKRFGSTSIRGTTGDHKGPPSRSRPPSPLREGISLGGWRSNVFRELKQGKEHAYEKKHYLSEWLWP